MPEASQAQGSRVSTSSKVAAFLFLMASCGAAYWLTQGTQESVLPWQGLTVDSKQRDFGEVWESKTFPWRLTVYNPNSQDVEIQEFYTLCGCANVEPKTVVIPAGGKVDVRLTVDLTTAISREMDSLEDGSASRPFVVQVVPKVKSAPPIRNGWQVQGRVKRVLTVVPPSVEFEGRMLRGEEFPSKTIRVRANVPLDQLGVESRPSILSVAIASSENNDKTFLLTISPKQDCPTGPFNARIYLRPVLNGSAIVEHIVNVAGNVGHEVESLPPALHLGVKSLGQVAEGTVVLRAVRDKTFKVQRIETSTEHLTVEALKNPRECYQIRLPVVHTGHHVENVLFHIAMESSDAAFSVPVVVSYYGLISRKPDGH
ncbi:MAG: hypothetical protein L0Y72_11780 [Gemmataceae bacterium]|nr:hypothetical protein [Gemmataceae bacterium]